jgi:restriction endonuclease S subunit
VHTTRFSNNFHKIRSKSKEWEAKLFKVLGAIKPKRLEYTEGKNKNNLHYDVSGHVMLTKSNRKRHIYQNGGDSDQSKLKNKFIRNKSKDSKGRLPDTKSTLYF